MADEGPPISSLCETSADLGPQIWPSGDRHVAVKEPHITVCVNNKAKKFTGQLDITKLRSPPYSVSLAVVSNQA